MICYTSPLPTFLGGVGVDHGGRILDDLTKIALLSTIYKLIFKEIYIYNVYTNGFHKNAKIYNLHQEMKKSTILQGLRVAQAAVTEHWS